MNIKKVVVGDLETNCYILENDNECLIIDPGAEAEKIDAKIYKKVVGIIITHSHFDHIGEVSYFSEKYDALVYDYNNLIQGKNKIRSFEFDVIYTPGHTKDSITIYFEKEKIMFVGDFIFYRTIGRTDLLGGNYEEMKQSIKKIKEYKGVTLYPGHGLITKLEEEKIHNIYFR